jgi:cytochrome d ubiquinol oxidase subunit I
MVDEFHWVWATEWCCFCVEVCAGYAFVRVGDRLGGRQRTALLALYAIAAWLSLFWINGILSWQLTPGEWLRGAGLWAGFFNPSFWPSLLFRTIVALTLAALLACAVIDTLQLDRDGRAALQQRIARLLAPMVAMPLLGLWFLAVIPADSRGWLLGGSVAMTMFVTIAGGASTLIGAYALGGVVWKRLYMSRATSLLLLALAFGATAAGEFVREGARKPYTVRGLLYSTSLTPDEVAVRRRTGAVPSEGDEWPLRDAGRYPTTQLRHGALVVRALCDACHTMHGANALTELTATWTDDQLRMNIAQLQRTKAFMPPFAGTADDVEAVAQLLRWEQRGAPPTWPEAPLADAARAQLQAWLDAAGTSMTPPEGAP